MGYVLKNKTKKSNVRKPAAKKSRWVVYFIIIIAILAGLFYVMNYQKAGFGGGSNKSYYTIAHNKNFIAGAELGEGNDAVECVYTAVSNMDSCGDDYLCAKNNYKHFIGCFMHADRQYLCKNVKDTLAEVEECKNDEFGVCFSFSYGIPNLCEYSEEGRLEEVFTPKNAKPEPEPEDKGPTYNFKPTVKSKLVE